MARVIVWFGVFIAVLGLGYLLGMSSGSAEKENTSGSKTDSTSIKEESIRYVNVKKVILDTIQLSIKSKGRGLPSTTSAQCNSKED